MQHAINVINHNLLSQKLQICNESLIAPHELMTKINNISADLCFFHPGTHTEVEAVITRIKCKSMLVCITFGFALI